LKIGWVLAEEVTEVTMKCPGQDMRNLRVSLHKCPKCGAEVEIFSDELRVKCHQCGEKVYKEQVPTCIDWCASARQCLGEERWRELRGEDTGSEPDKVIKEA
jgi:NADH pyrophosphatase NudC (nudix superfamily)